MATLLPLLMFVFRITFGVSTFTRTLKRRAAEHTCACLLFQIVAVPSDSDGGGGSCTHVQNSNCNQL